MSTQEIANQLESILSKDDNDNFIYDFLLAYGISKSVVTLLKKGTHNRSKRDNELLYAKKILFRVEDSDNLLNAIDSLSDDNTIAKHSPRFALMTDFDNLVAKDLKLGKTLDIAFKELPKYYSFFLPLAGSEVYYSANDNEADRNAAYKMAILYDHLIEENPDIYQSKEQIHHLNVFLSRLLFCFFAEDTGIFPEDSIFTNTLGQHTAKDGSDTHIFLDKLFARLDSQDTKDLPKFLADFPYVNGGLFRDKISSPVFSAKARKILMELGDLQWKNINPDIFGSMIQAVTTGVDRSKLGQHYTSVPNILKLIKPLFLDEFYEELEKATTINQLYKLQNRIAKAKFFDPACGSGNFLIITYKELRVLEIEIIKKIIELSDGNLLNTFASQIKISQFYGIEIDDFAHEIAILSLWLAEHQMNIIFEERLFEFAEVSSILPLKTMGNIREGNSLRLDWKAVCPILADDEAYVIGNPPYLGARLQDDSQKSDMRFVFKNTSIAFNNLDYIACWFYLANNFILDNNAKFSFVTTNSINQGEQVSLLWPHLLNNNTEINFAYSSFKWTNNAKGNAGVTVSIVSMRNKSNAVKYIFQTNNNVVHKVLASNINPYLIDNRNIYIVPRANVLSNLPEINFGSMANDGGNLLLSEKEAKELLDSYPQSKKFIKKLVGALEFIRGVNKYCLWIEDKDLQSALKIPFIANRIKNTEKCRLDSKRKSTQQLSDMAHKFAEIRYLATDSIIIPSVSSEKRKYIPMGFLNPDDIIVAPNFAIYHAKPCHFAIVTSHMHMVWVRAVSGKLKTDYRYSAKLCYNTFPFPKIDKTKEELLSQYVFDILEVRANHVGKTLKWMYDLETMPKDLKQAHEALDKAIEQCYQLKPFNNDIERLEHLFKLYEKMIAEEASNPTPKKAKR